MKIQKKEQHGSVTVELEGKRYKYDLEEWGRRNPYIYEKKVIYLEEWQIDLVENHGVELNEIQS